MRIVRPCFIAKTLCPGPLHLARRKGRKMTLSETTRNKTLLAILLLAAVAAIVAAAAFGSGIFQIILFAAFALSAAILSTFLVVALN